MKNGTSNNPVALFARCRLWTYLRLKTGDSAVLAALASWATSMGFPSDHKAQPDALEHQVVNAIEQFDTPESLSAIEQWLQALKSNSEAIPPKNLQNSLI